MGSLNQYRTLSTRHDTSGVATLNRPSNVLLVVSSGSAKGKETSLKNDVLLGAAMQQDASPVFGCIHRCKESLYCCFSGSR
jgi:hypothetical protein